jgi:hypothetical protein
MVDRIILWGGNSPVSVDRNFAKWLILFRINPILGFKKKDLPQAVEYF